VAGRVGYSVKENVLVSAVDACHKGGHRFVGAAGLRLSVYTLPLFASRALERVRLGFLTASSKRFEQIVVHNLSVSLLSLFAGHFLAGHGWQLLSLDAAFDDARS